MSQARVLAGAAENLYPARMQMALSLGWHIVFSCFGIALPVLAQRCSSLPLKPSVEGCQFTSACRTVEVLCISRRSLRSMWE